MKKEQTIYFIKKIKTYFIFLCIGLSACQKDLDIGDSFGEIKQVIIAYLYPNRPLEVNISRSKIPDDFNPVDFLSDCKVDLYEDGIFKETMQFYLKDTLSGLGYYRSSFNLIAGKTYKIISTHTTLGIAEATDYLPTVANVTQINLLEHADSINNNKTGKYTVQIADSALWKDYYAINAFYNYSFMGVNAQGDSVLKYSNSSIFSDFADPTNVSNNNYFTLFNDTKFDGQVHNFNATFRSEYKTNYKSLKLYIQVSKCSKNYYDLILQQISLNTNDFNSGQFDRINYTSNIINGYGHFSAINSIYYNFDIF